MKPNTQITLIVYISAFLLVLLISGIFLLDQTAGYIIGFIIMFLFFWLFSRNYGSYR